MGWLSRLFGNHHEEPEEASETWYIDEGNGEVAEISWLNREDSKRFLEEMFADPEAARKAFEETPPGQHWWQR